MLMSAQLSWVILKTLLIAAQKDLFPQYTPCVSQHLKNTIKSSVLKTLYNVTVFKYGMRDETDAKLPVITEST